MDNVILNIDAFLSISSRHHLLREWQRLGGHLNWLLNVLPWGQLALSELYQKTQGKNKPSAKIFPNANVQSDLWWLANTIPKAIGVRFLDESLWPDLEADITVWTDANLRDGLAFSYSNNGFMYQQKPQDDSTTVVTSFS